MFNFSKKKSRITQFEEMIDKGFKDFTVQIIRNIKDEGSDPYSPLWSMFIKAQLAKYRGNLKDNLSFVGREMGLTQVGLNNMIDKIYHNHINSHFG